MTISRASILHLYKDLFRYGQQLKFTEKTFFYQTIREKFNNKEIQNIDIVYKVYTINSNY